MPDYRGHHEHNERKRHATAIVGYSLAILLVAIISFLFLKPSDHITVLSIAGNVEYFVPEANEWAPVELNQAFVDGDSIRTGEKSGAFIIVDGRIEIKIGPETQVSFGETPISSSSLNSPGISLATTDPDLAEELAADSLSEDEEPDAAPPHIIESGVAAEIASSEDTRINLDMGLALIELKKNKLISKGSNYSFTVRTPTAYAGVRGTEFFTRVTPGDDSRFAGVSEFFPFEGTIYMEAVSGADIPLNPGEAFFADPTRKPDDMLTDEFSVRKMQQSVYAWSDQLKRGAVLDELKTSNERNCPTGMVLIPSGYITDRGSDLGFSDTDRKFMDSYCIDIYEYPNVKGSEPMLLSGADSYPRADYYCSTEGKRLCKSQEWERACRGSAMRFYPYGDRYKENVCNINSSAVHISGSHPECTNDFGVYDMVGNAWEITATTFGDKIIQKIPPDDPSSNWEIEDIIYENEARVIMGGSGYSKGAEATCSSHNSFQSYEMGILNNSFRCCR